MSDVAISASGLRKQYRLGQRFGYGTLRDSLTRRMPFARKSKHAFAEQHPVNGDQQTDTKFWALDDVSFEVPAGDVLGVIGRNGAGKSTLLKVLGRITEPTEGTATVRGRVGSLLDVGTGFHPELSGRENVFLNGAILGMRRQEIKRNLDDIIDFSGVSQFIDTPVKFYSSGMYLRLAFAVAAHLETEILLVDETLAVGDAEFQKRCLSKMSSVASEGRTILFVSHNLVAVQDICKNVLWLDSGKIADSGPAATVVNRYLQGTMSRREDREWDDISIAPGTSNVRLRRALAKAQDAEHDGILTVRSSFDIAYEYTVLTPTSVYACIYVYNEQGLLLFNSGPENQPQWRNRCAEPGVYREVCHIPGDLLNNGLHRVAISIFDSESECFVDDMLVLDIHDAVGIRDHWYGTWEGAVRPILKWDGSYLGRLADS